jgi:hypothetical protein
MPEAAQPAPETDEKKSRGLGSYVVWAFVAVMVYVLSSGPAMWFIVRNIPNRTPAALKVEFLYFPLEWAYENTPLRKPLGIYWHLWCPGLFDKSGGIPVPT